MEFTPWSLSVRTCQRRLAGHELPLKAAMLALSCFLCGSIWSFFSKRDNLGGEAYASETEPEEWISVKPCLHSEFQINQGGGHAALWLHGQSQNGFAASLFENADVSNHTSHNND